ncbi:MAG: DUF362 domain-containing protein [Deltaproteobacteria bacterium]|nr:MAG: DUF362 domain-containing protein [Deltaproteobacteria bacterium]
MAPSIVSIVPYEKPFESVRRAIELSNGFANLPRSGKVFIKPNIVFWTRAVAFPKWGMITTSRVMEDTVAILTDYGITDITIGEGTVVMDPKDTQTQRHAYQSLGYDTLKKKYGVNTVNILERPFRKIDLGDDVTLKFNVDALDSDFIVDLPVLKTHNQTVVSLGIKNLKGLVDIPSRKKCHSADPIRNLHFRVARLADRLPPVFTLIDGIYSLERGPAFDGHVRRSNLLVASADILAVDKVGSTLLGIDPARVPHLAFAAENHHRSIDLSEIRVVGEPIEKVASPHQYDFEWSENKRGELLPLPLARSGIEGISYPKYDLSLCTYCSFLNGLILSSIRAAWKGSPWEDIEVLTGKMMTPTPGRKKTILLGKCMSKLNKNHPDINEAVFIKGCPPKIHNIIEALHRSGIQVDPSVFEQYDRLPGAFMRRYEGKPEFDEQFFNILD